ncbi:MAG: ATP-binding cassette domain-containing protein [Gammaproteobacteria bacterium]|nr:ATP-binding cassette domain-containing protein [Gammaproteobacteria bacterium]
MAEVVAPPDEAAPAAAALRIDIAAKTFIRHDGAAVPVLRDVRFGISGRELVVLTGPSGCGKTTLLNLIAGLDDDFDGQITLPEHRGDGLPLSYIFQEPCLLPWRTVRENIRLALSSPAQSGERIAWLLETMGLAGAADSYPQTLSTGMSRRVALARGFVVNAPLLLMDEPFSSIDERTAVRLRKLLLSQLESTPCTVLFVTHNLREALFLGDRLLILSGRPATLAADLPLASGGARSDGAGVEGRGRTAAEIEHLHTEITGKFPEILG